jgi:methylisocitrate lyase
MVHLKKSWLDSAVFPRDNQRIDLGWSLFHKKALAFVNGTTMRSSPGVRFRQALELEFPLQIVGTVSPLCALLAEQAGFQAIYLSGAGVANSSHGVPDIGITTLGDVVEDARRITSATSLPLLVDIDTGWGSESTLRDSIERLEEIGVAAVHIEDQVGDKRCGHLPGKQLVSTDAMLDRIRIAKGAQRDPDFVVMARTDANSVEGFDAAVARARRYAAAGADMIFAEALTSLEQYKSMADSVPVPVLANLTEFGKTPMFHREQMRQAGIRMVLYPLTAFRAMNQAAKLAYETIRRDGSQSEILAQLQTRQELYDLIGYKVD